MNQIIDCRHCGAVNVIPNDEYFSGICESCGHDTNQIPEQEPDMNQNDLTFDDLAALAIGHLILDQELTDEQVEGDADMTYTMGQINAALDKAGIKPYWFKDRLAMYLTDRFNEFKNETHKDMDSGHSLSREDREREDQEVEAAVDKTKRWSLFLDVTRKQRDIIAVLAKNGGFKGIDELIDLMQENTDTIREMGRTRGMDEELNDLA